MFTPEKNNRRRPDAGAIYYFQDREELGKSIKTLEDLLLKVFIVDPKAKIVSVTLSQTKLGVDKKSAIPLVFVRRSERRKEPRIEHKAPSHFDLYYINGVTVDDLYIAKTLIEDAIEAAQGYYRGDTELRFDSF